jgi:Protein of unknown function (DUF2934)
MLLIMKSSSENSTPTQRGVNENLNLEEQVAERAHHLWQQRNGEHGNDLTHWFQAEREIA